jgi:hypothetical protein
VLEEQKLPLPQKESSKKGSKLTRPDIASPMIFQQRDVEILKAVYQHRFLSSSHLKRMLFGCTSRANTRLRKLWENGFLERHHIRPLVFHGSSEAIYSLGKEGIDIIAQALDTDRSVIVRARDKNEQLNPLFIDHLLEVNDFSLNFISLVEEHPDLRPERWVNERDAQDEYQSYENGRTVTRWFKPDGYGRYLYKDKLYSFFLELDRSTETNVKFEDKLRSYLEYQRSGSYQRKFGVKFFKVLTVTTTPRRMRNLKNVADALGSDLFWFTTSDNIRQRRMFQPVWMRACNEGSLSLLDSG